MNPGNNEPREAESPGVREDQTADGSRSAASLAQAPRGTQHGLHTVETPAPLSARPLVIITRGRVEYTAKCPGCSDWHRHVHLGDVRGPCGTTYELQPKRGRPRGK